MLILILNTYFNCWHERVCQLKQYHYYITGKEMIRACFWFDRVFYRHYDEFAATHNALIFRKEEKDALNRHVGPKIFSVRRHLSVVLSSTQDSRLLFNTYLIVVKMVKSANLSQESCRIFIYLFKSQSRNDINFFFT